VSGQHHASAALTPGKAPVPIVQEAGWAPEAVSIGAENLAATGFDPQTVQPVASRYTDYRVLLLPGFIFIVWIRCMERVKKTLIPNPDRSDNRRLLHTCQVRAMKDIYIK
jgi:hypothetical protein